MLSIMNAKWFNTKVALNFLNVIKLLYFYSLALN